MKKLTASQENYLECTYRFAEKGAIRVRDLAQKMGVQLPSVTRAIAGLVKMNLVQHESYGRIHLTDEGNAVGKEVVRRGNCLSRMLIDLMGMPENEADPHIHRLEHVIDEPLLLRLEALVDFALDSPAWVKRLQHRIKITDTYQSAESTYCVGSMSVHRGGDWGKSEKMAQNQWS